MNKLKNPVLKELDAAYPELNINHDHWGYVLLISTAEKLLKLNITEDQRKQVLAIVEERRNTKKNSDKRYGSSEKGRVRSAVSSSKRRAYKAYSHGSSDEEKQKIKAVYEEAARKTKETGVKYVVDHIVPLHAENEEGEHIACGLHVSWNLDPITETENAIKGCLFKDEYAQ